MNIEQLDDSINWRNTFNMRNWYKNNFFVREFRLNIPSRTKHAMEL